MMEDDSPVVVRVVTMMGTRYDVVVATPSESLSALCLQVARVVGLLTREFVLLMRGAPLPTRGAGSARTLRDAGVAHGAELTLVLVPKTRSW